MRLTGVFWMCSLERSEKTRAAIGAYMDVSSSLEPITLSG